MNKSSQNTRLSMDRLLQLLSTIDHIYLYMHMFDICVDNNTCDC